jgi:hypothetical protein
MPLSSSSSVSGTVSLQKKKQITSTYEREKRSELYKSYVSFEKKHGDRQGIEDVILTKQRGEVQEAT